MEAKVLSMSAGCIALSAAIALSGCATVTAIPIDPKTGKARDGVQQGIPYYLPAPYLLVTEVPLDPQPTSKVGGGGGGGGGSNQQTDLGKQDAAKGNGDGTAGATTNTSFGMFTAQYGVKLIYLPDHSRPMVLTQSAGIGATQLNPTLQDGWMLTSLSSSADSKVAETLASVASLISATHGGSSSGGSGTSGNDKKGGGPGNPVVPPARALPPGLYKLVYDSTTGRLTGLCEVKNFDSTGIVDAQIAQACPP